MSLVTFDTEVNEGRFNIYYMLGSEEEKKLLSISLDSDYSESVKVDGLPGYAAIILDCMVSGRDIHISGGVDRRLLRNINEFVRAFSCYFPGTFNNVVISADRHTCEFVSAKSSAKVGIFFSGGVDSLYAIYDLINSGVYGDVRNSDVYLVPIIGMDLDEEAVVEKVIDSAKMIAWEHGFSVLPISTNVKEVLLSSNDLNWQKHCHGVAKFTVAMLLRSYFDTILMGSGYSYSELSDPVGSMPRTDELWHTSSFSLLHVGAHLTRLGKIQEMIEWDVFHNNLRVCFDEASIVNCGKCPKCLLTIFIIDSLGYSDKFVDRFPQDSFKGLELKAWGLSTRNNSALPLLQEIASCYFKNGEKLKGRSVMRVYSYWRPSPFRKFVRDILNRLKLR